MHERKNPLHDGCHSAYAHAYQATCLTRHMPAILGKIFRLPKPKARYPHFPNARSSTRERGNDFRGWAIYTDGGTRAENGETFAGWCVIARSPHGRIDIMFGPGITTEAHPAFSGARTHSNNTAEMSAMIEALSFLGPRGPVARDVDSCIFDDSKHAAGVCLGTIQARTHVQLAPACERSMLCAQHRPRLTMQHVYGHTGLHLVHLASFPAITLSIAGFVIILTHLPIVVTVTASARSWENCIALELKQHRYLRMGVSAVFLIGFFVTLTHAFASLVVLLSVFFSRAPTLLFRKGNGKPTSSVSTASSFGEIFAHNMWNPLLELLCHEQTGGVFALYVEETDLAQIALSCHFALDFLCYKEGAYDSV